MPTVRGHDTEHAIAPPLHSTAASQHRPAQCNTSKSKTVPGKPPNQGRAEALQKEVVVLHGCLNEGGKKAAASKQNAYTTARTKQKCKELQVTELKTYTMVLYKDGSASRVMAALTMTGCAISSKYDTQSDRLR